MTLQSKTSFDELTPEVRQMLLDRAKYLLIEEQAQKKRGAFQRRWTARHGLTMDELFTKAKTESLREIAKSLGVSHSLLANDWRKLTGKTHTEWRSEL